MSKLADASINSFGISSRANFVPPSEQLVTLTYGQLQDLTTQAIEKAIQPLQDEVAQFRATIAAQGGKITALESTEEQDVSRLALDIAYDRQRLARLEKPVKETSKTELSRAEKIERYLSSRLDHKATFETLKGHLGVGNVLLNQTIRTLMENTPGRYGIVRTPGDKRKRTLVMLPK